MRRGAADRVSCQTFLELTDPYRVILLVEFRPHYHDYHLSEASFFFGGKIVNFIHHAASSASCATVIINSHQQKGSPQAGGCDLQVVIQRMTKLDTLRRHTQSVIRVYDAS